METKRCSKCKNIKPLNEFYIHKSGRKSGRPFSTCIECERLRGIEMREYRREWLKKYRHATGKQRPMETAKDSAQWPGIYIAERVLSKFFDHVKKMPMNNLGYDYICGGGYKIDAKSGCLHHENGWTPWWMFNIRKNQIADYFLCLAFDDRDSLEPQHVWLIPGKEVNSKTTIIITNAPEKLAKWAKYEKPLDRVLACCETLKSKGST